MRRRFRIPHWRHAALATLVVLAAGCSLGNRSQAQENAALRLHLHAATLVMMAQDAVRTDDDLREDLAHELAGMEESLERLREAGGNAEADRLAPLVKRAGRPVARLREQQPTLIAARAAARSAIAAVPLISAALDDVLRTMLADKTLVSQMIVANRQIVLADRIGGHLSELLAGAEFESSVAAADAIARDAAVFALVLNSFDEGNPEMGIPRIESAQGRAALAKVEELHAKFRADVELVLADATVVLDEQGDVVELFNLRLEMLHAARPRD